jgi:NRPS condensation-like uncharacterized protein
MLRTWPHYRCTMSRAARMTAVPLTSHQEQMAILWELGAGPAYHVIMRTHLHGAADPHALLRAMRSAVDRHQLLGSRIVAIDGRRHQVPSEQPVELSLIDARSRRSERTPYEVIAELSEELRLQPFDLRTGPLTRGFVVDLAEQDWGLILITHHIATDGFSNPLLLRDIANAYNRELDPRRDMPPPAPQYAEFAAASHDRAEERAELLKEWERHLRFPLPQLALPAPGPLDDGSRLMYPRPAEVTATADIAEVAKRTGATRTQVLLALYALTLSRRSGVHEVVIGMPATSRVDEVTQEMVGYFATTLPIRVRLEPEDSLRTVVGRVRAEAEFSYQFRELSFLELSRTANSDEPIAIDTLQLPSAILPRSRVHRALLRERHGVQPELGFPDRLRREHRPP